MISKKMQDAFNAQINKELWSSYIYQAMSAKASSLGFEGVANWFDVQVQEEMFHAKKMYNYVLERGGDIVLSTIEAPEVVWTSVKEMFEATLEHEQLVTSLINELSNVAFEERDRAAQIFLDWFIDEQVEEEANVSSIIDKFNIIGNDGSATYMLDKELGGRTFVAPTA